MALYPLLKPLLFALEPETAHRLTLGAVGAAGRLPGALSLTRALYGYEHPALRLSLWGREVANPVGLAAGFDKDGALIGPLQALGFGLVELGGVTPRPQPGNPRPRLFRLPEDEAIINRMGFNNRGADALAARLAAAPRLGPLLGVNLGKNRETPLERAVEDYRAGMRAVHAGADYQVVNVSSPNTPGLRELQAREALEAMVAPLCAERDALAAQSGRRVPLLVKLAPDLDDEQLAAAAEVARSVGVDGLVATNTAVGRQGLRSPRRTEQGGLSGRPIFARTREVVARLHRLTDGALPILGTGGVFSAEDAYALIRAGASAVQVYTALVYRGPGLVRDVKRGLVRLLARDGLASVAEAVGADAGGGSAEPSPTRSP